MTVYVDDMYRTEMGRFRHMKMSHIIADSTDELLAMADQIGLKRKWLHEAGTADEHFDIGMGLRVKAVAERAVGNFDDERIFLLAEKLCREAIPSDARAGLDEAERKSLNSALDEALKTHDDKWRENTAPKRLAIAALNKEKLK